MEGKERRELILALLSNMEEAITGTSLANQFNVSRQVIVQDIALLRAQGTQILATSDGYRIYQNKNTVKRAYLIKHSKDDIKDELKTIVDLEGNILNVVVFHPVYGEISADLMIGSRRAVKKFMDKLEENKFIPLMHLTGGEHVHVVEAESEEILDEIEHELAIKGYLIKSDK